MLLNNALFQAIVLHFVLLFIPYPPLRLLTLSKTDSLVVMQRHKSSSYTPIQLLKRWLLATYKL